MSERRIASRAGQPLRGRLRVPSDKSITQRAFLLGAAATGTTRVQSPLDSADTRSVRAALEQLGAGFEDVEDGVEIQGLGDAPWRADRPLDLGNSGTGARLLLGLAAGRGGSITVTGDDSLRRRPMARVTAPLTRMGVQFTGADADRLPLSLSSTLPLAPFDGSLDVASAQVKSAILFAALGAAGRTTVREPRPTRDHTERMLPVFGVPVTAGAGVARIDGPASLQGAAVHVPADPSSAAALAALAAATPGSRVAFLELLFNPRRVAFFEVLREMGAGVRFEELRGTVPERTVTLVVEGAPLHGVEIGADRVPDLIDELPLLAVLGTKASGVTVVRDAAELRVKESDRIAVMTAGLRAMGAEVLEHEDGFEVRGDTPLYGARVLSAGDHRMAMALAVAACLAEGVTELDDAGCVDVSYPAFFEDLERLLAD